MWAKSVWSCWVASGLIELSPWGWMNGWMGDDEPFLRTTVHAADGLCPSLVEKVAATGSKSACNQGLIQDALQFSLSSLQK